MKFQHSLSALTAATALALSALLAPAQPASAFNAFFDFNGYGAGTPAEAISAPGIGMYASSPNAWQIAGSEKYATLSGNVLTDTTCDSDLVIKLDSYYHTLSLHFAAWNGATGIRVAGYSGDPNYGGVITTQIHQGSANGISEGTFEGVATDDIMGADHIVISISDGGCLAIDDLRLDDMPVMETGPIIVRDPIIVLPLPGPRPTTGELPPVIIRGN